MGDAGEPLKLVQGIGDRLYVQAGEGGGLVVTMAPAFGSRETQFTGLSRAFLDRAAYRTGMATVEDAGRMAAGLPEVTAGERHGNRTWFVAGKAFAWERPFSKADIRRFGEQTPPDGPILAVRVADLGEKEAILAANTDAFFTIPHFDGYAAVLIQLRKASAKALREVITDGWLATAPAKLAKQYVHR